MKIFDIHAHIYPDVLAPRAVKAMSDGYDGMEVRCDGRLDTLLEKSASAGISRTAVHSVATSARQVDSINRFVLESAGKHPESLIPFAAMHPDMPDMEKTAASLAAQGFAGVKLHPELQGFKVDEPKAIALFRALAGRLPVLLHCGDYRCDHSAPERIRNMLAQVPGLTLVCAHLGGWTKWEEAASMLIGEDVRVDLSSSIYALDAPTAVNILRGYGVERVLFGTDYPMWEPAEEVERFLSLPLTDEEKEKILWTNHLSLFKR